jgi:hypothetical protein
VISYFIEHPTRGVLVEAPGDRDEKFHWSWSKPRTEALMFPNHHKALTAREALPANMREGATVMAYDKIAGIGERFRTVYK